MLGDAADLVALSVAGTAGYDRLASYHEVSGHMVGVCDDVGVKACLGSLYGWMDSADGRASGLMAQASDLAGQLASYLREAGQAA